MALMTHGCGLDKFAHLQNSTNTGNQGGVSTETLLHLPFARGYTSLCTQGVGGEYSHMADSTYYDLDFDTPNNEQHMLFAPIAGAAYVHMESSTQNFGYHVNIDLGDGTYSVLGHMEEIFIDDESDVAVGQLIGIEGCTGACTGDHVHIGLHEGDARYPAEYGTSIPVSYTLQEAGGGPSEEIITSSDAICGIYDGHTYVSALDVPMWHPNGSLVKVPSSNSVYVIQDGEIRWIETESTFWSHNYEFSRVALISLEEYSCYERGDGLNRETQIEAYKDGANHLWLFVGGEDDPERYRQTFASSAKEEVLASWGIHNSVDDLKVVSAGMMSEYGRLDGYVPFRDGSLLSEESTSDVYVISNEIAMPIKTWDVFLRLGYKSENVLTVPDGVISSLHAVGDCATDIWCIDDEVIGACLASGDDPFEGSGSDFPLEEDPLEAEDTGDSFEDETGGPEETDTDEPFEDEDDDEPEETDDPGGSSSDDPGDDGSDDEDDDDEMEPGSDLIQICYGVDEELVSGELFLDGLMFTLWDSDPADTASVYDEWMCADVDLVSGERFKMNAWFVTLAGISGWAAYNNECESIDWQGTLTVDGEFADPDLEVWSEEDWETDPCSIGGDAYVNYY